MAGEWRHVPLGPNCTKIGSGATPRGGAEAYLESGPITLIRSQNVLDFSFSRNGLAHISDAQGKALDNVTVEPNDILLNITGESVARVCIVDPEVLPARVNQHVAIIRADPTAFDQIFLFYSLIDPKMKNHLLALSSSGATRQALTKGDLERLKVARPNLSEQRRISAILWSLDQKIKLNRRMLNSLEETAHALFKAWFTDFDPVHANAEGRSPTGLSALFPSAMGADGLPIGWSFRPAAELFEIRGGNTPSTRALENWGQTHQWATPKDLSSLSAPVLLETERKLTDKGLERSTSGLLPQGSLLLSSRAPIGYMAFTTRPTAINQGFAGFVRREISTVYAWCWCSANMHVIVSNSSGSTFPEISKSVLRRLSMVAPNAEALCAFQQVTEPLRARMVAAAQESETLASLRNALLPRLVSGQLRVRDAERALAAG